MRVHLGSIQVSDEERRALRAHYGRAGLASRAEVRAFYLSTADSILGDDILQEYRAAHSLNCCECGALIGRTTCETTATSPAVCESCEEVAP